MGRAFSPQWNGRLMISGALPQAGIKRTFGAEVTGEEFRRSFRPLSFRRLSFRPLSFPTR